MYRLNAPSSIRHHPARTDRWRAEGVGLDRRAIFRQRLDRQSVLWTWQIRGTTRIDGGACGRVCRMGQGALADPRMKEISCRAAIRGLQGGWRVFQ